MLKKWIRSFLTAACIMIGTTAFAYSDDVGIMDRFNYDNSMYMYDYLNANDYRFYNHFSDGREDAYIKNDNSIFMVIANKGNYPILPGQMHSVIILKPGITTDKGIQVGSTLQDVVNAYGKIYPAYRQDVYDNDIDTGHYRETSHSYVNQSGRHRYQAFFEINYFDKDQRQIQILVSKDSKRVVAIRYWRYHPLISNSSGILKGYGLWRFILNY